LSTRRQVLAAVLLLASLTSVHLTGCSLVGFGIGAVVDNARVTRLESDRPHRVVRLTRGTPVTLVLTDSARVSGRLGSTRWVPDEESARRYADWHAALGDSEPMPAWNQEVTVDLGERWFEAGRFRGFAPGGIRLARAGKTREIAFERVAGLSDGHGNEFPLAVLGRHLQAGSLPVYWQVEVVATDGTTWVDYERIAFVELAVPKHGKVTGVAVGAAMDIAFIAAYSSMDHDLFGGCASTASVP
jgi:hypothetical protein